MRPTIAIDLDGVLGDWDSGTHDVPGDPIPGAAELTHLLGRFARVLVHTCRCTPNEYGFKDSLQLAVEVSSWLKRHGFYYDEIWCDMGKPVANLYVDDRGFRLRPSGAIDATSVAEQLRDLALSEDRITGMVKT